MPSWPQTGSNAEISQRLPTLSMVTRTVDAVSVGASLPTDTVWSTYTSATAWFGFADTEAAAGTVATAEMWSFFAPGITTSWTNCV